LLRNNPPENGKLKTPLRPGPEYNESGSSLDNKLHKNKGGPLKRDEENLKTCGNGLTIANLISELRNPASPKTRLTTGSSKIDRIKF
jgi:hypothetical protein